MEGTRCCEDGGRESQGRRGGEDDAGGEKESGGGEFGYCEEDEVGYWAVMPGFGFLFVVYLGFSLIIEVLDDGEAELCNLDIALETLDDGEARGRVLGVVVGNQYWCDWKIGENCKAF